MSQKLLPIVIEVKGEKQRLEHFFTDAKTGIIYYQRRINGKKFCFSTGETNLNKAKSEANKRLEARLGIKKVYVRDQIKDELKAYEKVKDSENLSYFTIKSYKRGIQDIALFWGEKFPHEITRDNLALWYDWWRANKDIEMENAVKWMRNFCKYLSQKTHNGMPILPAVPTISDPNRKKIMIARANKKERIISPAEFKLIHDSALNYKDALIVRIMYTMATRIDETLNLDFEKTILLDEPIPLYQWFAGQNKADLVGRHALHLSLISDLKTLRDERTKEGTSLLFPQSKNNQKPLREQMIDWDAWRKRAALTWHWTPHTFRHTCLTNILNDPRFPQIVACKQYRVSPQVALKTYVKTKEETMLLLRDAIEVKL